MSWNNYGGRHKGRPAGAGKYHNSPKVVDGIQFDSTKEARRYTELKLMQKAGMISGLELQKKYVLIPTQREPDTIGARGGRHRGKVIEKECSYYADFAYYDKNGEQVVEDVKSLATKTPQYAIKRKLMLYIHGIRVHEV